MNKEISQKRIERPRSGWIDKKKRGFRTESDLIKEFGKSEIFQVRNTWERLLNNTWGTGAAQ